jgi:hypothetical protein
MLTMLFFGIPSRQTLHFQSLWRVLKWHGARLFLILKIAAEARLLPYDLPRFWLLLIDCARRRGSTMRRGLVLWLIIMALETVHGVLRGLYLVPAVGEALAGRIGFAMGSGIVLLAAIIGIGWTGIRSLSGLFILGAIWAALTLVFEIGIGLLRGYDWTRIWAEIDPHLGGTMSASLTIMLFAPMLAARLRRLV